MNKVHVAAAVLLVFCGIWSCKEKEAPLTLPEEQDAAIKAHLEENGISLESVATLDSGVYFYRQVDESGPVNLSNIVSFYYILKNLDGQVVHSWQPSDGEPLKAERGSGTIYPPGFDEALQVMSEGDSYVFFFPSHKAFGELPIEGLPANSIVILEVEIVNEESLNEIRQSETQAINAFVADYVDNNDPDTVIRIDLFSGLTMIKTLRDTTAAEVPPAGPVTVNLAGSVLNGAEIYPISEFTVERDGQFQVVTGIEQAIVNMRLGERALILVPSELAYGPSIQSIPHTIKEMLEEKEIIPGYGVSVAPFTTLIFDVEVLDFQ